MIALRILGIFIILIRIFDLASKIWYIFTQSFKNQVFYFIFIASLFAPTFTFLLFLLVNKHRYILKDSKISGFILIFESIFASLFIYPIFSLASKKISGNFQVFKQLLMLSGLFVNVFQTTPLLIIQVFNQKSSDKWDNICLISISATAGSFIVSGIVFLVKYQTYRDKKVNISDKGDSEREVEVIRNTEHSQ